METTAILNPSAQMYTYCNQEERSKWNSTNSDVLRFALIQWRQQIMLTSVITVVIHIPIHRSAVHGTARVKNACICKTDETKLANTIEHQQLLTLRECTETVSGGSGPKEKRHKRTLQTDAHYPIKNDGS